MIKIYRTSIDGCSQVKQFKSLAGARKYAIDCVGQQDCFGGHYAVSGDGVVKITWAGVSREDLFRRTTQAAPKLVKAHQFYRRGNTLFCRQAGYAYDQVNQQIGRVVELMDNITGDNFAGYGIRHNASESKVIFNEEAIFATLEDALAHAKRAYLDYLDYLANDAA